MTGTLKVKCSITSGGGPLAGARACRSVSKTQKERNSHTIFLMLCRLKLPALRCFCTWLAEPWRILPLLACPAVGESSTFSLSIPGETQGPSEPGAQHAQNGAFCRRRSAPRGRGRFPRHSAVAPLPDPPKAPHQSPPGHKASSHSGFGKTEQTEAFDSSLLGFVFSRSKN